jgi:hypothetical protein
VTEVKLVRKLERLSWYMHRNVLLHGAKLLAIYIAVQDNEITHLCKMHENYQVALLLPSCLR